jgi:hypothetical protein
MQKFGREVLHHVDPRNYQLFAPMKTFLVGHQLKPDFEVLETTRVYNSSTKASINWCAGGMWQGTG